MNGWTRQRMLAVAALALTGATSVLVLAAVLSHLLAFIAAVAGLTITAIGAWWIVTERTPRRLVGLAVAFVGVALIVAALIGGDNERELPLLLLFALALSSGAGLCARLAVVTSLRAIDLAQFYPAFTPRRPVLICNPRSGGGKVERFGLAEKATAMGVEVVLLTDDDDLEGLARAAIARGADCIGMAGGDGSQALVASIALEHGVPFVCISAGTRNHFALDLGLNRDDPSVGLEAFRNGVLRRVDVGRVGPRLFVNNVSLGIYAEIVEQESYRDAKIATTTQALPDLLGSTAEPFDLRFVTPQGVAVEGPILILVSNNPYVSMPTRDVSTRRSLDSGRLGVLAVTARTGKEAAALLARGAVGLAAGDPNLAQFTTTSFEVKSNRAFVHAGVDGESLKLPTPVTFQIFPRALEILVPQDNPVVAAARRYRDFGIGGLWDIARGHDQNLARARPAQRSGTRHPDA